jgi:hypothetical protein
MYCHEYIDDIYNLSLLLDEITNIGLSSISHINKSNTVISIHFSSPLTDEQKQILDTVVGNHKLLELKAIKKDEVNSIRTQKLNSGYLDTNGIRWDSDSTAIVNLSGVCTLIALGVVTENQTWRDQNNIDHIMTPTDLVTLAGGLAYHVKLCYITSWTHKANIDAFDNITDLSNYDITTGWPQ